MEPIKPIDIKVSDYLSRIELKTYIRRAITYYEEQRRHLVIPDGCCLKRTEEDELDRLGLFNPSSLLAEFNLILEKKSKLSSSLRKKIQEYVFQGIYGLYQHDLIKAKDQSNNSIKDGNEEESRG